MSESVTGNQAICPGLPSIVEIDLDLDDPFILDLEEEERKSADQKFNFVMESFPDVEALYLRAKCAEFAFDNALFFEFIENNILSGNYPKENGKQPKEFSLTISNDMFEGWISDMTLEKFLKKYPEPKKYFTENAGGIRYINYSLPFLLLRYKFISKTIISKTLVKKNYNLYLADLELGKLRKSRKNERQLRELPLIYDRPPPEFIDELYFILKHDGITRYFQDREEGHKLAVEEARKANALLTCACCYDDEFLAEEVSNCSEGHIFCRSCIRRSTEILMADGKLDFPCLVDCSGSFDLLVLKEIISETLFDRLEKKLQEREIVAANIPGLERCSFCEYAAILPPDSRIFECDLCKKHTCRSCRKESHVPFTCEELKVQDELKNDRLMVEEKMTEALIRTCYKCGAKFIRVDGCNKMSCSCGAKMCYICRKPVKDYSHFYEGEKPKPNLCPLWTKNDEVHKREVDLVAKQAIAELKRKNPDLDYLLYKKQKNTQ